MSASSTQRVCLIILDGWGHGPADPRINAIHAAHTPFMDSLYAKFPHIELRTSGEDVGLPEGQMGNSEVGHMNIGAGRIVYQPLVRINKYFREGWFDRHPVLDELAQYLARTGATLHLLGLVSDGGVHSHIDHLKALIDVLERRGITRYYVHAFTDGRDTDPHAGKGHIAELQRFLADKHGRIASIVGRYYAMDRDRRWERIAKAYHLLVHGQGEPFADPVEAVAASYAEGITDEFITPKVMVGPTGAPLATIAPHDAVLFFNFRTDRGRQLTRALTQEDFPEFGMKTLPLFYITMTEYDKTFRRIRILVGEQKLTHTLGEVIAEHGLRQLRIAETEKYPHVTYFFSGGREVPFEGETRILVPSPKVATYDLQPEMSAEGVTQRVIEHIRTDAPELIVLNFANPDMVGHTGVFDAVVKAVETVDACTRRVVEAARAAGYIPIITADHGNADYMVNPDGSPHTAHTLHPVPFFILDRVQFAHPGGRLADIAPTILRLMHLPIPDEMTGTVLIS